MSEPPLMELVSNLPRLDDFFEESAYLEPDGPSPPISRLDIDCHRDGTRSLADLVNAMPYLDDFFDEDSVFAEMDCSTSMPARRIITRSTERYVEPELGERPPPHIVSDLAMSEDLFEEEDLIPHVVHHSAFVTPPPIPFSTKEHGPDSQWDEDEAYFSENSVSEDNTWHAAGVPPTR